MTLQMQHGLVFTGRHDTAMDKHTEDERKSRENDNIHQYATATTVLEPEASLSQSQN